ncbi:zinc transporter ZIP1 [Procambarus clarkii]|uniref:zinc transporter ZIP1 n=1 Tax=Procambarus clarkii TaxID=6728 RepID=UPI003742ECB7
MLSVVETKALALGLMACLTLLASFLPLGVRKLLLRKIHEDTSRIILTSCLCFGAGVLLSVVFVHLLPDTRETYQYAMDVGFMRQISFPVAEVVLCSGFFLVYLMEEIIHAWIDHRNKDEMEITHEGPTSFEEAKKIAQLRRMSVGGLTETRQSSGSHIAVMGVIMLTNVGGKKNEGVEDNGYPPGGTEFEDSNHNVHSIPHCHHSSPVDESTSVIGAVVVVVALSFHGIMEGLAIGLESNVIDVWILFGALTAHKLVIGFSMSMELLEVGVSFKPYLASMIVFSLASPIGCIIGSLVIAYSAEETAVGILLPNVLQSVAGGTILYITFCEVLERERIKPEGGWARFVSLLLGFGLMVALVTLEGGESSNPITTSVNNRRAFNYCDNRDNKHCRQYR